MRWLKFGTVGAAGVGVQLAALWCLVHEFGLSTIPATVLAVELALLHNFAWHEAWTWRGLPVEGRWARLLKFHTSNGFVSIVGNTTLTWLFHNFGAPLLVANLGAVAVITLLNFWMADQWVFRRMAVVIALLAFSAVGQAAVFTTKLAPETIAAWNSYIASVEHHERASADPAGDEPALTDLRPDGTVDGGYIHHWVGAIRIPNATVAAVRSVLENYDEYPRIYAPDVKVASATKTGDGAFDVRLITERVETLGLHFAFDIRSKVTFHDGQIDSRSYSIREDRNGKPPYDDWLPEGDDHGVVWRLNSYWRLRQEGISVRAECEVISLSRKPPLGSGAIVKTKARDSLAATLKQTRDRLAGR